MTDEKFEEQMLKMVQFYRGVAAHHGIKLPRCKNAVEEFWCLVDAVRGLPKLTEEQYEVLYGRAPWKIEGDRIDFEFTKAVETLEAVCENALEWLAKTQGEDYVPM